MSIETIAAGDPTKREGSRQPFQPGDRVQIHRRKKGFTKMAWGVVESCTYRDDGHAWKEVPCWDLLVEIDGTRGAKRKLRDGGDGFYEFTAKTMPKGAFRVTKIPQTDEV